MYFACIAVDLYADLKGGRPGEATAGPPSTASEMATSVININDLPAVSEASETAIFQSAIFIEDGIHYRSIHHRIDPTSLKVYRVYYSKYIRWLLGVIIFIDLMLAFIEYPTSLSLSSDSRFRLKIWHAPDLPCGVTESIEILCLFAFLSDCSLRFYLIGWRRFIRKPWLVLYAIMIAISFVDLIISLSFCEARDGSIYSSRDPPSAKQLLYTLRFRRYCRPLFFLLSSTIMKKFIKAVVRTLPQIISVLVLLVLHLYVFAMIGLLAFPRPPNYNGTEYYTNETSFSSYNPDRMIPSDPDRMIPSDVMHNSTLNLTYSHYAELEGSKYFNNVTQAFTSLLVLLTTANHPDIMMPIYQYNRFSSVYFILFLGIGAFLILNLLIAATYNQFKGFFQKSLQASFFRRRVAFRAAFTILARKTHQIQQKGSSRLSYIQEVASRDLVLRVLQKAKIPKKQEPQMSAKVQTTNSQCLNWHQFREVFDLASKKPARKRIMRLPFYGKYRWFQWIQFAIRHRFFAYFTYIFSVLNVILITVELQISYDIALSRPDSRLAFYNLFFVIYYVFEQILKLIGLGFRGYFRSFGNVYEGVLTILLVLFEILVLSFYNGADDSASGVIHYDTVVRIMNILIVFRLLRIVAHIRALRILISIIIDLFKNLAGFAGIMIIIYYLFALLGMALFSDINGATPNTGFVDDCGTYDNIQYFANNFKDFASSLVTLWDIMVVNNWFIFLDKFAFDSMLGGWSRLYFIMWWLLAAIMGMNLFVSLVLDTFLIKWDAVYGNQQEEDRILDEELDKFANSSNWEATASNSPENLVRTAL